MRLQRVLDGAPVQPPEEWIISRICEEFSCLPSEAVRELDLGDRQLVFDILELRSYVRAKEQIDSAKSQADVKLTPAVQLVFEIQAALMQEDGMKVT